ncbi:beta-galactosidase-like [Lutzomyia longipalpis]|uniref:Putative beta-galactosidase n=1 Tax=Lutzomyia longipalpis TaxID=7200 RepID=A0A1B0CQI5_LUTLO|nr:beta-galactosidase-like [Lutzomyia longipalpis]
MQMTLKTYILAGIVGLVVVGAVTAGIVIAVTGDDERTFRVGETDFEMDGRKFQYVAGSFHYFRAFRDTWKDKLTVMKSAGLNVIDTYVEWATHQPEPNIYEWEEFADLPYFLDLCQELGLYVILRPGPYICAERDNGGLPYWLFSQYPGIRVRTSDPNYLAAVSTWYEVLFAKIDPYLYGKGGNIIMVQVENEYGVFPACDKNYMSWLKNETEKYVGDSAVLFTVDIPNEHFECGITEGAFVTTDFGIDRIDEIESIWALVRRHQPTGPLVNSEFYPGWLTHWQEDNQRRDGDEVANVLRRMLQDGASVNFYMYFGGTNFGFTAGANDWGIGTYEADLTSYDYDAPMDEAGNPTMKLLKIRNVIGEFFTLPTTPVPEAKVGRAYPDIALHPVAKLFSPEGQFLIENTRVGSELQTFESLRQMSGLVLYETNLPKIWIDPTVLTINGLADRALVYQDDLLVGCLSRGNAVNKLPLNPGSGSRLKILVENQGRVNFNKLDDIKGILDNVTIQQRQGELEELRTWDISGYPLTNRASMNEFIQNVRTNTVALPNKNGVLTDGPVFFLGTLTVTADNIGDTYLDTTSWGKGVLYVNGFNLGRYWPVVGPQITLYIPESLLRVGANTIMMLEYQKAPIPTMVSFKSYSLLDG